jgi:hypothetical protein
MPLHSVVAGGSAAAADLSQFIDLLTGVMTDQLVTLAGGLALPANSVNTVPIIRGTIPGGVKFYIQPSTPASPVDGDVWFQA